MNNFKVENMPIPPQELDYNDTENNFLVAKDIIKRYRNGFTAINHASFSIGKGKTLGLVGESGCGKSTLARCILMLENMSSGDFWIDGVSQAVARKKPEYAKKYRSQMHIVFQDSNRSLNSKMTILDSLLEPLDHQPKDFEPHFLKGIRNDRVKVGKKLLEMMELPESYLYKYPHELSGGQKQRVTIARSISIHPQLIILDEPTASLDVSVQAKVLNLLKDLQKELGISYLFISHDLSAVKFMSDKIIVMYKGHIVDRFESADVFAENRHPYTKQLLDIFESRV